MVSVELTSSRFGGRGRDRNRGGSGIGDDGSTGSGTFAMIVIVVEFASSGLGRWGRDGSTVVMIVFFVVVVFLCLSSNKPWGGCDSRSDQSVSRRG